MEELMAFAHDGNECYEVARSLVSEYPNLNYVEGRYYRALNDGDGNPDLPGHAWAVTPAGTIIDPSFAQFNPFAGTEDTKPIRIVDPTDKTTQERYLPDDSPELHKLLKDNGWVDYKGWPNQHSD